MTRDPYAALRSLNIQGGEEITNPGHWGGGDSMEWREPETIKPWSVDWQAPGLAPFKRGDYTQVVDRGDGTMEVLGMQVPGGSKHDQMNAVYRQDPATGKWVMQGDPTLYKGRTAGDKLRGAATVIGGGLALGSALGALGGAAGSAAGGAAPAAGGGLGSGSGAFLGEFGSLVPAAGGGGAGGAAAGGGLFDAAMGGFGSLPEAAAGFTSFGTPAAALPAATKAGSVVGAATKAAGGLSGLVGSGLEWVSDAIGLPEGVGDLLGNSSVVRDLMGLASAGVSQWNIEKMADDNRKWQSGERQKDRDYQDKKEADARARRAPVGGTAGALRVMRGG